jgi:uncharacterized protein (TIGR01777 family)
MKVAVTGATGFIGQALCNELAKESKVIALTRRPKKAFSVLVEPVDIVKWNSKKPEYWQKYLEGLDVIINLAGANVASGRWTEHRKEDILNSRLETIHILFEAIKNIKAKPKLFIQSSAIGFYGCRDEEKLDEDSEAGEGFLSLVCKEIESACQEIESLGIRIAIIRSGVVLGMNGGALPKMAAPFRFYLGGYYGGGEQWISWISLADEVAAIKFLIQKNFRGVFNLTSPRPVRNKEFFITLAEVLNRPCWLPLPEKLLQAIFGQMADELFLTSQRVLPNRLLNSGFEFEFPNFKDALENILNERSIS